MNLYNRWLQKHDLIQFIKNKAEKLVNLILKQGNNVELIHKHSDKKTIR